MDAPARRHDHLQLKTPVPNEMEFAMTMFAQQYGGSRRRHATRFLANTTRWTGRGWTSRLRAAIPGASSWELARTRNVPVISRDTLFGRMVDFASKTELAVDDENRRIAERNIGHGELHFVRDRRFQLKDDHAVGPGVHFSPLVTP